MIDVLMTSEYINKFSSFQQLSYYRIRTELDARVNKLRNLAINRWLEAVIKAKAIISDPNFKRENYNSFDDYYETELEQKFNIDDINREVEEIFPDESYEMWEMWEVEVKGNWFSYWSKTRKLKVAEVREFWKVQNIYNDKVKQFEIDLFDEMDEKTVYGLESRYLEELFEKSFMASANRLMEKRKKLVNDNSELIQSCYLENHIVYPAKDDAFRQDVKSSFSELKKQLRFGSYPSPLVTYVNKVANECLSSCKTDSGPVWKILQGLVGSRDSLQKKLDFDDVFQFLWKSKKCTLYNICKAINIARKELNEVRAITAPTESRIHYVLQLSTEVLYEYKFHVTEEFCTKVLSLKNVIKVNFMNRAKGLQGQDKVINEWEAALKMVIKDAFESFCLHRCWLAIKDQKWFTHPSVLLSWCNMALYSTWFWESNPRKALRLLKDHSFYNNVMECLIAPHVRKEQWFRFLRASVLKALDEASQHLEYGVEMQEVPWRKIVEVFRDKLHTVLKANFNDRLESLVQSMRNELRPGRAIEKKNPKSEMVEDLKKHSDGIEQTLRLIKDKVQHFELKTLMPSHHGELNKVDLRSITKKLREFGNDNTQLRCNAKCPWCHDFCILHDGHEGKHLATHQPIGLVGIHYVTSGKLTSVDCVQIVESDIAIKYEGETVKWMTVFSDKWEKPTSIGRESLDLKRYMFYHGQAELTKEFHIPRADNIPEAWNKHNEQILNEIMVNIDENDPDRIQEFFKYLVVE